MKTVSDHPWMETSLQWFRMNSALSQNYKRHHVNFPHFSILFSSNASLAPWYHSNQQVFFHYITPRMAEFHFLQPTYVCMSARDANVCACFCLSVMCHCLCITCLWKCSSDFSVSGAEASNFTIITSCVADDVITDVVRADLPLSWFNPPFFTRNISLLLTLNANRPYNQPSRCRGRLYCSILACSAHIRLLLCH